MHKIPLEYRIMSKSNGKNGNKSENITIRVSTQLKESIYIIAEQQNIKPSEYIRNCIIANMENRDKIDVLKKLKTSINKETESRVLAPLSTEGKLYIALSQVIANDVGFPPDYIYHQSVEYFKLHDYTSEVFDAMHREMKETVFNNYVQFIIGQFGLSQPALLILKSIYMTHLSNEYNSPISISSSSLDLYSIMNELKGKPFWQSQMT